MHPCPGEETKFKALSREVNRNVTTDLSKIVSLLSSEEWAHVNQGYELYRSLADPDLGPKLLGQLFGDIEWASGTPASIRIDVRAWEDDFESITFTAGEESWEGGVQHGGKTTVPILFQSDDADSLSWVVTCLREDHWDSTLPLEFEYPDSTNGKCSDPFYMNSDGVIIDGEPEPSAENDSWVEREYLDGMGSVYSASYGFSPAHFWCSIDDVEVAEVSSRAVLLGAALVAGVELDQLPSIDHEGRQSELDSLKSSCCDRF